MVRTIADFADRRLGKGVVIARDTPNFIANHLGLHGVMQIFRALESGEFTIEEIDAITGPAIGRPKSATFRTMDIAGIDVLAHVARNLSERLDSDADRALFRLPGSLTSWSAKGWIGAKAGQGFYKKEASGEILTLDPVDAELSADAAVRVSRRSMRPARSTIPRRGSRRSSSGADKVGEFLRATLGSTLVYAARVTPDIAHAIDDVDRAMRWGFGWDLGPVRDLGCHRRRPRHRRLRRDRSSAARCETRGTGGVPSRRCQAPCAALWPGIADPAMREGADGSRAHEPGASLVDLGDGVLCVEFHSKMNAIGGDTIQMLHAGVKEAATNFAALVVGNDAPNFSAGANLMLLLLEAQEGNWDEVDLMVRAFQGATMALKYADVPVVVAPAGLTLGGGCEIALHGDRVQAAAETYMGLVEVGVGLIPAGGGTKEMLARAMDVLPRGADLLPAVQRVFETIGFAKVSTSGPDAARIGYLRDVDGVTMNRERLIADAKARRSPASPNTSGRNRGARFGSAAQGCWPRSSWASTSPGAPAASAITTRSSAGSWRGSSPAETVRTRAPLTEQQLLDLEREAFLSLCGERRHRNESRIR